MNWILRMAWRDSRGRRRRLLVYTGAISVGIAALTSLRGLGRTMERSVDQQASVLLGADLEVERRSPFSDETDAVLDSIGGRRARQVELNSMVYLPRSRGTRLAQVRAMEGGYPFYGELRTDPPAAADTWQAAGQALVEDGLLLQFGAAVGDTIRVGHVDLRIAGRLLHVPGETSLRADVQPRVFIPLRFLEQTGLVARGSRVEFRSSFQFEPGTDIEALARHLRDRLDDADEGRGHSYDIDTVADRKRRLGRTLGNLYRFLGLGSFVALLLGAVGVASAVHAHVEQKLETVAVLRSLGASSRQALLIYLTQAGAMGLIGSLAGAVLGSLFVLLLPGLLGDFLPAEISDIRPDVSPGAFLEGTLIGASIALLFAALPLVAVRRASPLLALRASYESEGRPGDRALRLALAGLALAGTYAVAHLLVGRPDHALYFTGGSLAALLLLALAARLLRGGARRLVPAFGSYLWRQGLANLYRPHNQTLLVLVSLGLGTFLVAALFAAQSSILAQIESVAGRDQPNMVLFDIQTDQKEEVAGLVLEMGMPLLDRVPIVTMYVASVKGEPVEQVEGSGRRGGWALRREYRSTYRDTLTDAETLTAGAWRGTAGDSVFVSLEKDIAASMGVSVGDAMVFDVQGISIPVVVGSLREVEWQRIMPNFFVVFPAGVLEAAPQFHVLVTRASESATRAELQRRAVERFPNLTVIDLDLVLSTVDGILDKVAVVVRLMALFSIATGLIVLIAVVSGSRFQRLRESALLRTLGGSRSQVVRILLVEYLFLGGLSAVTGLGLALLGGWGLARGVFEVAFAPPWAAMAIALAGLPAITVLVGFAGSRGIHAAPPLETLRRAD